MRRVLIADDEESIRHVLTELLEERGYEVRAVTDGEEAMREVAARDYDALVTDVRMPKMNGLDLVRAAQTTSPETTIIVMSAYGSHDLAIEAMKAGAYDYLGKPFRPDEVLLVLRKAEERERLRRENLRLRREASRRPTAPRCGSTRSASCRWRCSRRCCACCSKAKCAGWAIRAPPASTSGCWRRPIAISRRTCTRAGSARTSTTASMSCRCAFRRCASGRRRSRRSRNGCSRATARGSECRHAAFRRAHSHS